jgi:uncharacterized membrane protein
VTAPQHEHGERLSSTGRVEAFSDGVIAIAITLLVLDLRVPDPSTLTNGDLLGELLREWPRALAYVASFLTIAVIWLNHHALVDVIAFFDRRLHWLNLLLLFAVATIPAPTALVAEYVKDGGPNATVAAAAYGLLALLMAVPWALIWIHLRDHPELMEPEFDAAYASDALRRNLFGPVVYAIGLVIALVAPLVSLVFYAAVAAFFAAVRQGGKAPAIARTAG